MGGEFGWFEDHLTLVINLQTSECCDGFGVRGQPEFQCIPYAVAKTPMHTSVISCFQNISRNVSRGIDDYQNPTDDRDSKPDDQTRWSFGPTKRQQNKQTIAQHNEN